jgi:hypothetical protein
LEPCGIQLRQNRNETESCVSSPIDQVISLRKGNQNKHGPSRRSLGNLLHLCGKVYTFAGERVPVQAGLFLAKWRCKLKFSA